MASTNAKAKELFYLTYGSTLPFVVTSQTGPSDPKTER